VTVPLISQSLATRIGVPSLPPRPVLVDWCEVPNDQLKLSWERAGFPVNGRAGFSNQCSPIGGEFCFFPAPDESILTSTTQVVTLASQEPGGAYTGGSQVPALGEVIASYDMTGKAISFRFEGPSYPSLIVPYLFRFQAGFNVQTSSGSTFARYGVGIELGQDFQTGYTFDPSTTNYEYSGTQDAADAPWIRIIFDPDGETVFWQRATDCAVWETMATTTVTFPRGFRDAVLEITGNIVVFADDTPPIPPVCVSQIYVEDFDPCMIEEES
jgi:hypothetical protein